LGDGDELVERVVLLLLLVCRPTERGERPAAAVEQVAQVVQHRQAGLDGIRLRGGVCSLSIDSIDRPADFECTATVDTKACSLWQSSAEFVCMS